MGKAGAGEAPVCFSETEDGGGRTVACGAPLPDQVTGDRIEGRRPPCRRIDVRQHSLRLIPMTILLLAQAAGDNYIVRWPPWVGAIIAGLLLGSLYGVLVAGLLKASSRWGAYIPPALALLLFGSITFGDPTFPGASRPLWLVYLALAVVLIPFLINPFYVARRVSRSGSMSFGQMWRTSMLAFVVGILGCIVVGIALMAIVALT